MNASVKQNWIKSEITTVVLEIIHPRQQVEVSPSDLPQYVMEYGSIRVNGQPATLVGVRLSSSPDIVSYAGNNWRSDKDGKVTQWNLYIGVSHSPGLTLTKI